MYLLQPFFENHKLAYSLLICASVAVLMQILQQYLSKVYQNVVHFAVNLVGGCAILVWKWHHVEGKFYVSRLEISCAIFL